MTLYRQIALLVSIVLLLLVFSIVLNDVKSTGNFLENQLQTTAQDMATTMGIAISNHPTGADKETLEVLFNAVFDSGYYTRIELIGVDGLLIHQKSREFGIEGVPDWFVKMVPISPAYGSTQVVRGWIQLGQLNLSLHPGLAYSSLYQSLISTLGWLSIIFILSLSALWIVLQFILRPLERVRQQAEAIQSNKFVQQQKMPATIELKRVVEAMNLMVSKVQGIFDDQEKTLARYQQLLYRDELTNLGNRNYLLDQLQQSLSEESANHSFMAIIKIVDFESLRERQGYELSENLIIILANILRQQHADHSAERLSRPSDDEFAFLFAGDSLSINEFIESVFSDFKSLTLNEPGMTEERLLAGVCPLEANQDIGSLLASLDYCLSQAGNRGSYAIEHKSASSLNLPQGKMQWRSWLESVLESRQFFLVGQLAFDTRENPVQRELFVRVQNKQDQVVPASAFMPMASSLGMSLDIDKEVFNLVTESKKLVREVPIALNLSAAFFELAEAQEEFNQLLIHCEKSEIQLCIEASHHVLQHHPLMCANVSSRVRQHGHQFGMDNLDLGQSLRLLQSAFFDYVKINAKILSEMSRSDMSAGYQALRTITDTLDIRIIAVGVDSQTLFDELQSLGIEVMQGNFLNAPEPI